MIRLSGHPHDAALDLTQDYFTHLLEKGVIARADPAKGQFRAFLRADCGFFLSDQRDRQMAQKRGGGQSIVSINAADADRLYSIEPADPGLTPDLLFDRSWARALLERSLASLGREFADSGRSELFDHLKIGLTDGLAEASYAMIAARLGMTPSAVESSARRMRKRFALIVHAEIAQTLDNPGPKDIEDEIRSLFVALGS